MKYLEQLRKKGQKSKFRKKWHYVWNWNFKLLYWFFYLYSFLLAVGCCSNFKQEFWSAVVSLKEKWLQAANICKQRHFGHIFASLLYESCLKGKANNLARLDKFEFVGLVKVICEPVVHFFRSIFLYEANVEILSHWVADLGICESYCHNLCQTSSCSLFLYSLVASVMIMYNCFHQFHHLLGTLWYIFWDAYFQEQCTVVCCV